MVDELRKALKEKSLVIGKDRTLKKLKRGGAKKVFLALNCPKSLKEDVKYYGKLGKVEVVELKINNNELGVICKKPFSISVLCY